MSEDLAQTQDSDEQTESQECVLADLYRNQGVNHCQKGSAIHLFGGSRPQLSKKDSHSDRSSDGDHRKDQKEDSGASRAVLLSTQPVQVLAILVAKRWPILCVLTAGITCGRRPTGESCS